VGTREFVKACKEERDALLAIYTDPDSGSAVSVHLSAADLAAEQRKEIIAALDAALTDAFYVMLMGLAGAASLGGAQQEYRLADEAGQAISPSGDADLEMLAYEVFQADV
jgi:hypothetical protein